MATAGAHVPAPVGDDRPRRPVVRLLLVWIGEALGLALLAWILPGVEVKGLEGAFVAAGLIGLLNALLYPLLASLIASIALLTFGLLTLVLNVGLVLAADAITPAFNVEGFGSALVLVLGLALVNSIVTGALAIDDEGSFYRSVVRRQARRSRAGRAMPTAPGVIFLEIDGLSEKVLRLAIEQGHMPNLARWIESGSHRIKSWECDLSSQTSASQAGLLHGNNEGIPAFRWFDRELGRAVVSAKPDDAALIEQRASDGHGLLAGGGASRANLLSGDAPQVTLTLSCVRISDERKARRKEAWRAYLSNPYNTPRTLLLFISDVITELLAARKQRRQDSGPRVHRGGHYPLVRAATTSLIVEASVSMLIGDLFRGVPCAYATFVAYDEVAHHSGIVAPDALAILTRLDRNFGRLARAARSAPRPYDIVVLSDHGQSHGAPFAQRYGRSLDELVQELAQAPVVAAGGTAEEAAHQLDVAFDEIQEDAPAAAGWAAGRIDVVEDDRGKDGDRPQREGEDAAPEESTAGDDEILVFASGNLGLIYFRTFEQRATIEEIETAHPGLLDGLAAHEGVGFVAGVSAARGPVAIGADGERPLDSPQAAGIDPLAPFGRRAADHLRRELAFRNAPDLLVVSSYYAEVDEVAAFEDLVGSHGGLGGPQSHPFLLHPTHLLVPDGDLVGAGTVHHVLKSWVPQDSPAPVAETAAA
jgi:uncharacterized membrane protein YvlD (DUF360 family)